MIKIVVEGETATAEGPFPFQFLSHLSTLSGRKTWHGSEWVKFQASPSNIRRLKEEIGDNIEWIDKTGELKAIREMEKLASQHQVIDGVKGSYHWETQPFPHQEQAYALSLERPGYAYLLEMGLGKTAICLANIGELHLRGQVSGVLVLAPKGVHRQWLNEQVPEHLDKKIKVNPLVWKGKPFDLKEMNKKGLTILSMNIDSISTKKGFTVAHNFMKLHNGRSMMVVDESHMIKSWKAKRTKAAWALGDLAKYKRIMTGTPIAKNILDAWSQFYFLDWKILGYKYMTAFRSRYCIMGGFEGRQIIGQKNVEEFYRLIAPHAYRKTKAECLDLPPKIYSVREYEMDDDTRRHYQSMKKTFMTELKNGSIVDAQHAAVAVLRLQQIACGYLPDPEKEGKGQIISNDRIEVLLDIIEQVNGPVVIWCRFISDINRIYDRLTKSNVYGPQCAVQYYGDMNDEQKEIAKKKFLSGSARFFIGNPQAGGTGLNLQGACQTAIYFSNSFRALDRWQSEDRLHRMGTTGAVSYIDLIAVGSVDRAIMRNLKNKKSISDLTFDEIRQAIAN